MPKRVDFSGEKEPGQAPPNYFSRRVQLRLLMLVGLLMLTITMMFEAAKPSRWYWLWGGRPPGATSQNEPVKTSQPPINTVLQAANTESPPDGTVQLLVDEPIDLTDISQHDFYFELNDQAWPRLLRRLDPSQRKLLYLMLRRAREGQTLPGNLLDKWPAIVERLGQSWANHLEKIEQTVAESKFSDPARAQQWRDAAKQLEQDWDSELRPMLKKLADRTELTAGDRDALAQLASQLDKIAWDAVKDDTVFRSVEQHAWFGTIDQLRGAHVEQMTEELKATGFHQLYTQPNTYRGKLVTIDGVARLGYQIAAPQNEYGAETYFVIWIKPVGTRDAVVTVYCLNLPDGFPELADRDATGETTSLNESVRLSGIFFKRWAYQAQDTTRTSPLVIADSFAWDPKHVKPDRTPGRPSLTLSIAGCGIFAIACAWLVYRWNRPTPLEQRYSVKRQDDTDKLKQIDADLGESHVQDALAKLADPDSDSLERDSSTGEAL